VSPVPNADDWDTDSTKFETVDYAGTCRCGHRIHYSLPAKWMKDTNRGQPIRCAECRSITHCQREKDEDVVDRNYESPLVVDADEPGVTVL